jgi:hypothetical protein
MMISRSMSSKKNGRMYHYDVNFNLNQCHAYPNPKTLQAAAKKAYFYKNLMEAKAVYCSYVPQIEPTGPVR